VTPPVIAIDGPAGVGKSSVSRAVAARLGFRYVDTGAMYRAVGVLAAERGVQLDEDAALAQLVQGLRFEPAADRLLVDGRDLSGAIRRPDAGELASRVSTRPVVRERLVALQRGLRAAPGLVMEGRDIGTVVFPDAPLKIFLTAAPEERARRRAADFRARGERVDEAALAGELAARDRRDSARVHSPLRPAADAEVIDTSTMPLDAVVEAVLDRVRRRGLAPVA
jgi:CMP/dCMP kinase